MNGKAHLAAGLVTGVAYANFIGVDYTQMPILTIVSAASIGAWLPDIDIKNSSINHLIKRFLVITPFLIVAAKFFSYRITIETLMVVILALIVFRLSKHRSLSHSLLGLIITFFVFQFSGITDFKFIIDPFALGFVSHIFLDMLTPEGVELFFPVRKHIKIF
ncbi:metal-dependent hydrolase [Clostridium saccharoperbutylacetonicum]|uniref:metal-dependent hydrolase n=1 Tax=Clostridium saccharoperbutylacetonicum TaxID=36745 RepID=UPI0039E841E0